MIELQTLRAVNGHDLHRIYARGFRSAVQVLEEGCEILGAPPLKGGGPLGERGEERACVRKLRSRVGIRRAELYPGRLEPVCRRAAVAPLERPRQYFAHARQAHEVTRRTAREAPGVRERFPDELQFLGTGKGSERRQARATPGSAQHG